MLRGQLIKRHRCWRQLQPVGYPFSTLHILLGSARQFPSKSPSQSPPESPSQSASQSPSEYPSQSASHSSPRNINSTAFYVGLSSSFLSAMPLLYLNKTAALPPPPFSPHTHPMLTLTAFAFESRTKKVQGQPFLSALRTLCAAFAKTAECQRSAGAGTKLHPYYIKINQLRLQRAANGAY